VRAGLPEAQFVLRANVSYFTQGKSTAVVDKVRKSLSLFRETTGMLRLIAVIVVSLYAAAPSFATPARLSLPNSANSILLEVQARRAPKPSGELQRKYRENGGIYNDKPTSIWKKTPPTPTDANEYVDVPEAGSDLPKENKETDGRLKRACPTDDFRSFYYCHFPNATRPRRSSD